MSDSATPAGVAPASPEGEVLARMEALKSSVRRLWIWLIVVSVVLACVVVGVFVAVAGVYAPMLGFSDESMGATPETVTKTRQEIQNAYGDRIGNLTVRTVKVDEMGLPFPYSMASGTDSKSLYVEYTLKDSNVVVADLMGLGPYGDNISASGMLPTKGSLVSRMSPEQFDRLLLAYGRETKSPLGSVRRYGDAPFEGEGGAVTPDEVTVGGKKYSTKELWSANEGRVITGDSVDLNDESDFNRNAFIFREDPATGEFVFLGTEPADTVW